MTNETAIEYSARMVFRQGDLVLKCDKGSNALGFHWDGNTKRSPYYNAPLDVSNLVMSLDDCIEDGRVWIDPDEIDAGLILEMARNVIHMALR